LAPDAAAGRNGVIADDLDILERQVAVTGKNPTALIGGFAKTGVRVVGLPRGNCEADQRGRGGQLRRPHNVDTVRAADVGRIGDDTIAVGGIVLIDVAAERGNIGVRIAAAKVAGVAALRGEIIRERERCRGIAVGDPAALVRVVCAFGDANFDGARGRLRLGEGLLKRRVRVALRPVIGAGGVVVDVNHRLRLRRGRDRQGEAGDNSKREEECGRAVESNHGVWR
jgi:hypothetical protein